MLISSHCACILRTGVTSSMQPMLCTAVRFFIWKLLIAIVGVLSLSLSLPPPAPFLPQTYLSPFLKPFLDEIALHRPSKGDFTIQSHNLLKKILLDAAFRVRSCCSMLSGANLGFLVVVLSPIMKLNVSKGFPVNTGHRMRSISLVFCGLRRKLLGCLRVYVLFRWASMRSEKFIIRAFHLGL